MEKDFSTNDKYMNVSIAVFIFIAVLSFVRLYYGTELTDEAYAVAEGWIVAEGGIPFINVWSQIPGGAFSIALFCWIYFKIMGTTKGMFLFGRYSSFVLTLLFVFIGYKILKKIRIKQEALFLYLAAYIIPFWHGLTVFRADRPALFFSWISSLLAVCACSPESSADNSKKMIFFSGVCSALSVLMYSQMVVYCLLLFIYIIYYSIKSKKILALMYIYGGIITAVIITGYLVARGGFDGLINGLNFLIKDVAYFRLPRENNSGIMVFIQDVFENFLFSYIIFGVMAKLGCYLIKSLSKYSRNICNLIALIAGISTILWKNLRVNLMSVTFYLFLLLFLVTPTWIIQIRKRQDLFKSMFFTMWIPSGALMVVASLSTYANPISRTLLLGNGALLFLLVACYALEYEDDKSINEVFRISYSIVSILVCVSMILNVYCYIYRDGELFTLNTRVDSGAYKGVYTTSARAEALIEIEEIIRTYTDRDDYLLAMECVPFVYLMSDAHPCTPSSWDQSMYWHGFNEDNIYMDYFAMVGREPSKIIYVISEIHSRVSIDEEGYLFNDFVNENYEILYENREIQYPIVIYSKKNM